MKKKILDEIKARLGDEYEVKEMDVTKNNGIVHHGVAITKKGECIAPNIYYDGVEEDDIADFVIDKYEEVSKDKEKLVSKQEEIKRKVSTKEGITENVFPVLVNREKNEQMFNKVVHRKYLDMEITFKVDVGDDGFVTITNELLGIANITEEELYEAAMNNIHGKSKMMKITDMLPIGTVEEEDEGLPVFVLTNKDGRFGASMVMDDEVIETISDEYGDFFVIPSSIHEVLIIPESFGKAEDLKRMVVDVNGTLEERDVLSDNVYICRNKEMEIA